MSNIKHLAGILVIEPRGGEWVGNAARRLVRVACICNQTVYMEFNGYALAANPDSNSSNIRKEYMNWINS